MKYIEKEGAGEDAIESDGMRLRAGSIEMQKNILCEPKFTAWLESIIEEVGMIALADAINGGAMHAGCSQQVIKRYLDKLCSFIGPYEYFTNEEGKRYVRLKQVKEKTTILPISSAAKGV